MLTTFNETAGRVAMHAVRRGLVEAQAAAVGLPLWPVLLPYPCSNEVYEERMRELIGRAREQGVTHTAFGDLFLEDVRDYRIRQLEGSGIAPLFPLWGTPDDTPGPRPHHARRAASAPCSPASIPGSSPARFVGRTFDEALLADLPPGVDPCGERGEFHTFCCAGPMFDRPLPVVLGETVERDGFCFADLLPAG